MWVNWQCGSCNEGCISHDVSLVLGLFLLNTVLRQQKLSAGVLHFKWPLYDDYGDQFSLCISNVRATDPPVYTWLFHLDSDTRKTLFVLDMKAFHSHSKWPFSLLSISEYLWYFYIRLVLGRFVLTDVCTAQMAWGGRYHLSCVRERKYLTLSLTHNFIVPMNVLMRQNVFR